VRQAIQRRAHLFVALGLLLPLSCQSQTPIPEEVQQYWYQGEAEIGSYRLTQSRYGEPRRGYLVLIWVTEDFSKEKQVKLNDPSANPSDVDKVLKLNAIRRFETGIYDYSTMRSVFASADWGAAAHLRKLTFSAQDWCGQTFLQAGVRDEEMKVEAFSYFESEGDQELELSSRWSEDLLWLQIRLDPSELPTGKFELLPSVTHLRLSHKNIAIYEAEGELQQTKARYGRDNLQEYMLHYPQLKRTVRFYFERERPHRLLGWEEEFPGLKGNPAKVEARLIHTEKSPYWKQNGLKFNSMREKFSLPGFAPTDSGLVSSPSS